MALDVADFEVATGQLTVRAGKGRKDRTAYATNGAATALLDWMTERGSEDEFRAFKFDVLRVEDGVIAEITTLGAGQFPAFGLPPTL